MEASVSAAPNGARQHWISTLSKADPAAIKALWDGPLAAERPGYEVLRAPEIGLVMVRGRTGGTGDRFNLGEMTVTRCAVRLATGETGVSYRGGRDKEAAEISAVIDAMLQREGEQDAAVQVIAALDEAQTQRRAQQARRSGATKVNFFTMTRTREDKA